MNAAQSHYYDGLNQKLLAAIPTGARRVLELGCANGHLGRRFKELNANVEWHGVDLSAAAVDLARTHLDSARQADLDQVDMRTLGANFDTVVIGDLLEHLRDPARVLEALYDQCATDATIVCCLPNMSHISVIQRLIAGDISYDDNGLLDRTHLRFFSQPSVAKLFLDSGWLPHVIDEYRTELQPSPFTQRVVEAAQALGVPAASAMRHLGSYQVVMICHKWSLSSLLAPGPRAPFSVIVPVNRPWQYELNIARSPGLQEVGAQVICVQADSAAEAYAKGAAHATNSWRVMAHQDVYFPRGSGFTLAMQLGQLESAGLTGAPAGFAGIEADSSHPGASRHAGLVIDRRHLFSHGPSQSATSLDELAVCLHKDSEVHIDKSLGWHLWATDLCLQAEDLAGSAVAQILQVPLFHNSVADYVLPPAFHDSAHRIKAKYPGRDRITTLCGELQQATATA